MHFLLSVSRMALADERIINKVVLENEVLIFKDSDGIEITTFDLKDKNFGFLDDRGLRGYKFRTSANTEKSRLIQMQLPGFLIIDDKKYKFLESNKAYLTAILSERVYSQPASSSLPGYQRRSRKARKARKARQTRKQRKTRRRV